MTAKIFAPTLLTLLNLAGAALAQTAAPSAAQPLAPPAPQAAAPAGAQTSAQAPAAARAMPAMRAPAPAPQATAARLRTPAQQVAFACTTRDPAGQLALCAPAAGRRGALALRFAAPQASARTVHSARPGQPLAQGGFGFAASETPGSARVALRFEGHAGNQMLIHQRVAGREIAGWVSVDAEDEWHYEAVCEQVTVMALPALRDQLVCDPHNQLGVNACP
jgi:hypothetical protein